jgi:hypothetical protein
MDNSRLDDAKRIVEETEKELESSNILEMIKNNEIIFPNKLFKVRLLTLKDKEELLIAKRKKYMELLQEKNDKGIFINLTETDLYKTYKERGINIEELDKEINKLQSEEKNLLLQLGEAIAKNESESILKSIEDNINELRGKQKVILTQKNLLLNDSLENQIEEYFLKYMTYLSLEEKRNEKWEKMFSNFQDFCDYGDESFLIQAGIFAVILNRGF